MSYWEGSDRKVYNKTPWEERVRLQEQPNCGVEPINVARGLYRLYPRTTGEELNKWVMTGAEISIDLDLREECRIRKIGYALTGSTPTSYSENEIQLAYYLWDNDSAAPWCLWHPDIFAQTGHKCFAEGYEEPARRVRLTANGTLNDRLYSFIDVMVVSE